MMIPPRAVSSFSIRRISMRSCSGRMFMDETPLCWLSNSFIGYVLLCPSRLQQAIAFLDVAGVCRDRHIGQPEQASCFRAGDLQAIELLRFQSCEKPKNRAAHGVFIATERACLDLA